MTDDWFEFLAALLDSGARFLVVGAHALAVHGVPRATQDLDIWVDPTEENARRVWAAWQEFGAPAEALGISRRDLITPGTVVQFGLPPNRIDLMTSISGIDHFDAAWSKRMQRDVRGRLVPFLSREDLLRNKRASGRRKDLGDIDSLGESDSSSEKNR